MPINPTVLEGTYIRLEPLSMLHHAQLCEVGLDPAIWMWIYPQATTAEEMRVFIESALKAQAAETALPFATVDKSSGKAIGSTRFGNMDLNNRRVEIGWTWIAPKWQRTVVNTEAKLLMLRYAFETLKCMRVELKTDALNERSRAAILRLGAKQEGIFRKHMLAANGRIRDTVYFSITDDEWPAVASGLKAKMARSNS
jgi:RimJ/RimL family protein N-acetyltransferase